MTAPRPFGAVLFDMDGVLVDSEHAANQVWVRLLAQHGLHLTPDVFMTYSVGATLTTLYAHLERDHGWTRPGTFDALLDAEMHETFRGVPQVPGAEDTLRALAHAHVPFAVASNSRADRLQHKLTEAGLADHTAGRAYHPQDVGGHGKPEPHLYQHAARELGVDLTRCLVVEDSVPGVTAGVAAGATVWGFLGGSHGANGEALLAAGAARLIASHADLRAALGVHVPEIA
ncbi:HAD family hydrolase [Deinococcus maricopensis]|uniref:HAD-superfamily hydrolase, subfamily IA, variant 3 n=1 Tax=Deinococcus maricopensis (strain DSM 21211 / LMG 22137 / NRRL B-23946 / LB-34) TaxID=709986 RepID=E8U836_DEIML|nr:HAD-IA family hydrolase [Deinococcus maricopensis]ADV67225.1 HAD-superfamily hydrolase, subfamily IA, variant 3 [Deinococcus maricopensis DSM 21211]